MGWQHLPNAFSGYGTACHQYFTFTASTMISEWIKKTTTNKEQRLEWIREAVEKKTTSRKTLYYDTRHTSTNAWWRKSQNRFESDAEQWTNRMCVYRCMLCRSVVRSFPSDAENITKIHPLAQSCVSGGGFGWMRRCAFDVVYLFSVGRVSFVLHNSTCVCRFFVFALIFLLVLLIPSVV